MQYEWQIRDCFLEEDKIAELASQLGLHTSLVKLLDHMGLRDVPSAQNFLYPKLSHLSDPLDVPDLEEAVKRLCVAIHNKEKICVMGDYDVDGVTSIVLLVLILNKLNCFPRYFVPRRMEEGYGLSAAALERLMSEEKPDLLFVLDSGTNAYSEVEQLRKAGVDVIIIDHHRSKDKLPEDCILVNPHVHAFSDKKWKHLCTVGLVFKLVHALLKKLRQEGHSQANDIRLRDYLDLVALGTVADLMPLEEENRILVKYGLKCLSKPQRLGLKALYSVSGILPAQELRSGDIAFKLGPRINASGRIADAALPVAMLLSQDYSYCIHAATHLDSMNKERQDIEKKIAQEAQQAVELHFKEDPGLILYNPSWHSGVVGIVAGRLARHYNKPCIVLGQEGLFAKGSGRSVLGFNLVEILGECNAFLESWGGHPMAVGTSLRPDWIKDFRNQFNISISKISNNKQSFIPLHINFWLNISDIDESFLNELDLFHPFGEGNPEPIVGLKGVVLKTPPDLFGDGHYRFSIPIKKSKSLSGVAWQKAGKVYPLGLPVDFAVKINWNHWNGRKSIQLELLDWRLSNPSSP